MKTYKVIGIICFILIMFLSIFSSMCPKYVPIVEVPLYLMVITLGTFWILKAITKKDVILRVLLVIVLGVMINILMSSYVHNNGFPFEMFDEATQKRIMEYQQNMLQNLEKE